MSRLQAPPTGACRALWLPIPVSRDKGPDTSSHLDQFSQFSLVLSTLHREAAEDVEDKVGNLY